MLEINNAARLGKLSPIVTFQEAQELEYLRIVIKEALRLFPAGKCRASCYSLLEIDDLSGIPTA